MPINTSVLLCKLALAIVLHDVRMHPIIFQTAVCGLRLNRQKVEKPSGWFQHVTRRLQRSHFEFLYKQLRLIILRSIIQVIK